MVLTVLSELIVIEEKHNIKTDISDISKTNAFSLNKCSTENALLYQTLALKELECTFLIFKIVFFFLLCIRWKSEKCIAES